MKRRSFLAATAAIALCSNAALAADSIKFGVVSHLSGPLAGGEAVTHTPNVDLWCERGKWPGWPHG